jgi:catechol 2,3-dioxygenase-like lactoylglutathione lyase family enzyme
MLGDTNAVATVAVKDIERAAQFYEGTLGLARADSPEKEILLFKSGQSTFLVYPSQYAGTNQATAVTWPVADVDGEVRAMKQRGVKFERYDIPNMTHEGDVHVSGNRRTAWFKDPDGNILALVNQK